jgi:ribosomal protein L17
MTASPRAARMVTRALIAALEGTAAGADATNLRRIVDSLVDKAIDGDLPAIREIFDRVDGKAVTAPPPADNDQPEPNLEWARE